VRKHLEIRRSNGLEEVLTTVLGEEDESVRERDEHPIVQVHVQTFEVFKRLSGNCLPVPGTVKCHDDRRPTHARQQVQDEKERPTEYRIRSKQCVLVLNVDYVAIRATGRHCRQ